MLLAVQEAEAGASRGECIKRNEWESISRIERRIILQKDEHIVRLGMQGALLALLFLVGFALKSEFVSLDSILTKASS